LILYQKRLIVKVLQKYKSLAMDEVGNNGICIDDLRKGIDIKI